MILVTGASGQLGRLVVESLLEKTDAGQIIAGVRDAAKVQDLAAKGVQVRTVDYSKPETLDAAFKGVEKLLLISSSEFGQRQAQHKNVIEAAKRAGVLLVAYTSLLHASTSPLSVLSVDHAATEALLAMSGMPYTLLRNGWYSENYTGNLGMALEHGVVLGCAEDGKLSLASRHDYAEAAAVVLLKDDQAGKVYELAGDEAITLTEYAAAISEVTGKTIAYQNLPEAEFCKVLMQTGLPEVLATAVATSDTGASKGGLYSDSHDLSTLIGRPTTSIKDSIKAAL